MIIVEVKPIIVISNWVELIEWLAENVGKCFSYKDLSLDQVRKTNLETFLNSDAGYMITNPISSYNFHFKDSKKAMLFKLTWGGK